MSIIEMQNGRSLKKQMVLFWGEAHFLGYYNLGVDGQLEAIGTEMDSIVFCSDSAYDLPPVFRSRFYVSSRTEGRRAGRCRGSA
ncbi:hypothetical protein JW921_06200, partial [Candidatus Fermentibacterales bacterium]|nr:hypothetical protein [Candidatus Fermentibacterales bacterium]